ncbi:hypothetical protein C0992_009109 [Termitomyces sp. T32_za158]|nr:hypothetical protein C0992_009109 [Termitomyces sp. T32_za158]
MVSLLKETRRSAELRAVTATEVPGTFRVNGSNRRTRDLQTTFERPPDFGRKLNWASETYTTHDIASVFRRYLTHLPEPVIPHGMYHSVRILYLFNLSALTSL